MMIRWRRHSNSWPLGTSVVLILFLKHLLLKLSCSVRYVVASCWLCSGVGAKTCKGNDLVKWQTDVNLPRAWSQAMYWATGLTGQGSFLCCFCFNIMLWGAADIPPLCVWTVLLRSAPHWSLVLRYKRGNTTVYLTSNNTWFGDDYSCQPGETFSSFVSFYCENMSAWNLICICSCSFVGWCILKTAFLFRMTRIWLLHLCMWV